MEPAAFAAELISRLEKLKQEQEAMDSLEERLQQIKEVGGLTLPGLGTARCMLPCLAWDGRGPCPAQGEECVSVALHSMSPWGGPSRRTPRRLPMLLH